MKQQIKRFLRAAVGKDFYPKIDFHCDCLRLGSAHAGWTIASEYLNQRSVVYCVGIGEDISFDLALQMRFGMEIHAFDPTPKSLAWVRQQALPPHFHVHDYGLADVDGIVHFRPPDNPEFVSHSMVTKPEIHQQPALIAAQVHRLDSIREKLGHPRVDLLKMDIEGAEYAVIDDFGKTAVLPRQLLVEFHHRQTGIGIERTKTAVRKLRDFGYRLFHVSPNGEEYAFLIPQVSVT